MDSSGDPIEIIENSDCEKNTEKKSEEIVKEQEIIKNVCENDNVEITSELTEAGKEPENKNLTEPNVEDLEKEEDFQLLISDEEPAPQIIDENLVETIEPERLVPDEMGKKDENNFEEKRNLLMECGVLEIVDDKETSNMGENQQDIEMDQNIEDSLPVEIVKSQEDLIVTDNTLCDASLEKQNVMTIDENTIANDEEAAPNIVEQDECVEAIDLKPSTKEEDISISVNVEKGEEKEICVEKEIEIDNSTIAVECLDEKLKNEEKNGDLITKEKIKEFTEMVSKDETNLIEEKDVNLDEKSVLVELAEVKDTKPENETEDELDGENEKHTQDNVEIINKSDDNKKVPLEGIIIPSDDDDDEENNDVNARDNEKENNQINYGEEKQKYDDQKADDDQEDEYDTEDSESDDTDHDDSDDDDEEDDDEKEDNDNDNIKSKQIKIKKTSQNIYDDDVTEDEDEDDDVDDNDLEEEEEEEEEQEYNSAKKKPKIEKNEDDDDIMILSSDDDEKPPPQIEIKPSTSGISMKSQKPKHEENNINELNQWDEDDDMDSDDYDDDDLMNDVVMATAMRKVSAAGEIFHRKSRRIDGIKLSKQIRFKKKLKRSIRQIDYRSKVKNRSIKWLCSKMLHHSADDLMVQQQMAIIDDLEYTSAKSAENKSEIVNCFQNTTEDQKEKSAITSKLAIATTATTQNKIDNDDVIELDSSPEKSNLKTLTSPNRDSNAKKISLESITTTLKENSLKMQPLEKVRETITKSNETSNIKSELKDQEDDRNEKCNESDQNKENIENNENQVNGKEDEINEIDNENQLDQNKDEKSMINEKQLFKDDENKEKQKNETTSRNDKNLELMDVSENEILNENKNDNKNLIKTEVKESSNYATNDIKINDNSKSPEPPTSINTTTNQLNNRKRLRSRSINEDQNESNISNNIRLTSTPLANHKDHNKEFINSTEPQNMSTATATKTVPLLNSTSTSTNAYNNNNNNCDDDDNVEQIHPMKKLRAELETNFTKHDSILAEYIERTTNETPDDIDKHISQLAIEIHTLNDMIKAKEYEWNNMLHLKKVKEEICFRLTRKKQVMELMATKLGEITNHIPNATTSIEQNLLGEKLSIAAQLKIPNLTNHHLLSSHSPPTTGATSATTPNPSLVAAQAAVAAAAAAAAASGGSSSLSSPSTVVSSSAAALAAMAAATSNLLNYSNAAATTISSAANKNNTNNFLNSNNEFSLNSTSTSAAQNILQLRANMKSSDLAKEKNSAQKIHRNILPKPSTATSSSQQQQLQQHQQLLATSLIQNAAANSGGGGASASQLAGLSGLFGSATAPVVLSSGASGGGGAAQIPLPLSNVATGSLMSAHTPPGATQTATTTNPNSVTSLNHQPTILNNYLTAAASVQQQLGELFNGHHNPNNAQNSQNLMVGRQGVFKDVKSIIADYRQRHPEQVPRRGRRMKSTNSNDVSVGATGQNRLSNSELNNLLNRLEAYSRGGTSSSHSSNSSQNSLLNAVVAAGQQQQQQTSCAPTSTTTNYNSTFSPTLARLLTAPERITNNLSGSQNSTIGSHQTSTITAAQAAAAAAAAATSSSNSTGLNLTKVVAHNSEITITPVMNSNTAQQTALQHSLLQKQIKEALNISKNLNSGNTSDRIKSEYFMNMDDEADDSVDRLVIDEGGGDSGTGEEIHRIAPNAIGQEFHENEVPWCQGCKNQEAQFVCAGCGSQWYCSRECQVQAWDEHSETCTG